MIKKKILKKIKFIMLKILSNATNKDLTFFHSKNYSEFAFKTKASYCVTLENLSNFYQKLVKKLLLKMFLLTMAKITKVLSKINS